MALPVQSMTGSGAADGATEFGATTVELRSVNGRTLVVKARLPGECFGLEAALESWLKSKVRRGTFFVSIIVTSRRGVEPFIDPEAAERAAIELRALNERLHLAGDVDLSSILSLPGVLATAGRPRASAALSEELMVLLESALCRLVTNRIAEGAATVVAMEREIALFSQHLECVRERTPKVVADVRSRLLQRVNEFLAGRARALEDQDVIHEVALLADRADVAEELDRLSMHLVKLNQLLADGGEVGRSLEFLLQEILRETNTLGSKSPDAEVAHAVVAMKTAVERLKEQAANLE